MGKEAPKVFISYSHDSPDHKKWVANLGMRLRQNGVDVILDQWDLFAGEDIPAFVERNLSESMFAILVCTKRYVEKANSGKGGVGYEKMIVTSELVKNMEASKFIPLIRQRGAHEVPKFIQTKLFIDFSNDEDFEAVFDELLRTIFRSSVGKKPPLGTAPTFNESQMIREKDSDLSVQTLEVFKQIAQQYESGSKYRWELDGDLKWFTTGKIVTETAFSTLVEKDYLRKTSAGIYYLSAMGKKEIVRLGLV